MSAVFQDIEFGSRFPELAKDHPRRVRGEQLYGEIAGLHKQLRQMGPWEEDWTGYKELHFPTATAQTVRITFNWNGVRLDELEIFGPKDRRRNLVVPGEEGGGERPEEVPARDGLRRNGQ